MPPLLDGDRRETGQLHTLRIEKGRQVAHHERLRVARNREVGPHQHAAHTVEFDPERTGQR